jgi:transposase-like protein
LDKVIRIDEAQVQAHLSEMVRSSVEETLNALLDAEADRLCQAKRYERTAARQDTRAGSYPRELHTKAGEVTLKVPKLRTLPFETAIIERYQRRETSVEEALIEMYLAGVSVRRVEDITEALWGTRVSPSTVSELNKKIYVQIEAWRNRPLEGRYPYVYLDGVVAETQLGRRSAQCQRVGGHRRQRAGLSRKLSGRPKAARKTRPVGRPSCAT